MDLLNLPISRQTLIDLNDEVELNALLGVGEYIGMDDVDADDFLDENEDEISEELENENDSDSDVDIPGVRLSVVINNPRSNNNTKLDDDYDSDFEEEEG